MPTYPTPADNPLCHCRLNPMAAFFCQVGHMLECHAPYDCQAAGCSHLCKYDFEPAEVDRLATEALSRIRAGLMPPYQADAAGSVTVGPFEFVVVRHLADDDDLRICPVAPGYAPPPDPEYAWGGPFPTEHAAREALERKDESLKRQLGY